MYISTIPKRTFQKGDYLSSGKEKAVKPIGMFLISQMIKNIWYIFLKIN